MGLLLLLAYFGLGVIYSVVHVPKITFTDENEYIALSDHIVHGPGYSMDGVTLTACRPPGYAFFLAAVKALGGNNIAIRVVQFALLAGTILLLAQLCPQPQRVFALPVALALVAIYPVYFYVCGTLYPQTLGSFLFVLFLVLYLQTPRHPVPTFAAGLVFGILFLVIPGFLLTLFVVLLVGHVLKITPWRDALIILAAAALLAAPWTLRNAVLFHQFVPIASNSGVNLLLGNSGDTNIYDGGGNLAMYHYYQEVERLHLNEFQADHFYRQAAVTWITQHPVDALALYLKKVFNFFNVWNEYAPGNTEEISNWKQLVMAASYLLLIGLLGWRLTQIRQFPLIPREKFFLVVYLLSAVTMAVFLPRIRHRLPYDYLLIAVIVIHLSQRLNLWLKAKK